MASAPSTPHYLPNGHQLYHTNTLPASFSNLSLNDAQQPTRSTSIYSTHGPRGPPPQQPANTAAPPSLTAPLPTIPSLLAHLPAIQQPSYDPAAKVAWCRDVLALVDRAQQLIQSDYTEAAIDPPIGPARIDDPELQRLVDVAVPLIIQLSSVQQPTKQPYVAEALYLLAQCESTGAYPQYIQRDPRMSFRHCEQAAKSGYHPAWFRLGRDYENFKDNEHARQCFERGVKRGVESCIYRMGMANLMGQLDLPVNAESALPLLHRAATLATIEVPQPAYIYGLLLLNEFAHVNIPPELFAPYIPAGSSPQLEARKHLERAAYLNFAPAQYKLGHAYEFAMPPFPFDALLSVQYYSLASQQGEDEADMALSKWFLCGSEGAFERDEALAWTFAEKAARKGLPSAEFAMGYYAEVGVGGPKDIEVAQKWYTRAAEHGNVDASDRLKALSQPQPDALSREQHETLADTTIVRKRTLARQRSEARRGVGGPRPQAGPAAQGRELVNNLRQQHPMDPRAGARSPASPGFAPPGGYPPNGVVPPSASAPQLNVSGGYPTRAPGQIPPSASTPQLVPGGAPGQGQGGLAPPRPFANATRYSLVDPGASPAQTRNPSRQNSTSSQKEAEAPAAPAAPKPPAPRTFEEMGISTAKLEEKECIIM
ncbi:uncharacterized protein LAESUDRAFT_731966 [Laetiporus sulphureus 93-53]|uniref:HCP-like protein n=1 Tax=Laetiporus sulphureus 93-53 TaxID=1314785 RepID=A0A165BCE8_9APHY|nr:uncharacterized protein LAESUDRAFT_731966 [Laetiporus sulphureus 93-53]KZT00733.1 hypothetical protein LAESUDRAFT_731966 [Laetiporus sulphureus 93-53]